MMNALKLIILLPFLSSCASEPLIEYRTEYLMPPELLMRPCPVPEYTGSQWVDVARYAALVRVRLAQCDKDKAGMREWAEQSDEDDEE